MVTAALCLALMAWILWRLVIVVPGWTSGAPPASAVGMILDVRL
jgi:hypothetical protein